MTDQFTVGPDGDGALAITDPARQSVVASSLFNDSATTVFVAPAYGPLVWQVLTSVLTADEATVERVAEALTAWNNPPDPFFVIRGRTLDQTYDGDPYALIVEAVLAALTQTVQLERRPKTLAEHTADALALIHDAVGGADDE